LEAKLDELKKKKIEKPVETKKSNKSNASTNEDEMSEEEKAKLKSKPISSVAVPGTPWCVVWTRDKRVFFYNPSEKISLWERPQILTGRADVDKLVKEPPAQALDSSSSSTITTTTTVSATSNANSKKKSTNALADVNTSDQPALKKHKIQVDEENSGRGDMSVSPKSAGSNSPKNDRSMSPNPQQTATEFLQKNKIEASKEAAIEAENQAAQVRAQLPLEQRMQQFKDMLEEKQVSAYSTWERELQKIVFDPRYLLLSSKERKQVFEKYVKDRANQESKEKAAALKRKKENFNDLLKEANVNLKTNISFSEFAARHAKDERFKAIEKTKDRESLYNDYLSDLRKIEKEEKYAEKEKLKKAYITMLKEMKSLHRNSSWTETKKLIENDPRYKAIDSSTKREDYFRDHCKYLDEKPAAAAAASSSSSSSNGNDSASKSKDKEKSSEHKSEKRHKSEKAESKSEKKNDDNESKMDVEGSDEGETLEKSSDLNDESNDEERRKEKEKQDRIEASLRERNKEVKKIKEEYNNEREKEREILRHDEAIEAFKVKKKLFTFILKLNTFFKYFKIFKNKKALLIDIIKPNLAHTDKSDKDREKENSKDKDKEKDSKKDSKSELTWKEAKKILKRDTRWSYSKALEKDEKEKLFDEHMEKFRAKKRDLFHQLLDENQEKFSLKNSTWKEVKKLIKHDARYEKLHSSDSFKMEKEFESYLSEKLHKAKLDFKELLLQTKLITYKTYGMIKETPQNLTEIEDLLSKDKCYIVLECATEERKKILLDYIEKLHNEGPPPPPTATEPNRRK
jgi:transcription elongation regulator 1